MIRRDARFIRCKGVILAITVIACGLLAPAYCEPSDVALLLQQTPSQGGVITPSTGVYHFAPNSEVTLTAMPRPGYRFMYWLGDVSSPTTSSTIVHLNEPKIIVAVFEPTNRETLAGSEGSPSGGTGGYFGGSGLLASATDFGGPSATIAAGSAGSKTQGPVFISFDGGDGVGDIPEPATGVLLVAGSLFAFARRGRKSRHDKNVR